MNFEIHCNYIWIDPIVKYFFKNKINWKVILSYKKLSDIRINYLCIALKSESIKCFIICFLLININIWFTWSHNSLIIDWKDSFIISYVQKCWKNWQKYWFRELLVNLLKDIREMFRNKRLHFIWIWNIL